MSILTYEERTQKRWTIQDAITAAKVRLDGRPIDIYRVRDLDKKTPITLEMLNAYADRMVEDTYQYM